MDADAGALGGVLRVYDWWAESEVIEWNSLPLYTVTIRNIDSNSRQKALL